MNVLHLCPANLATGGTAGIHRLVSELNHIGADAGILYYDIGNIFGTCSRYPQPEEYKRYDCPYVTEFPEDYSGAVIFPEVIGNAVTWDAFKKCTTVINWQGIDVYDWNTRPDERGLFLQNRDTMHITMSQYGMVHLRGLGLHPMKIPDMLEDEFYDTADPKEHREDVVLYNPVEVKMTDMQRSVMGSCIAEHGVTFLPLSGYTQAELIDIFHHSKLYIDFGEFSGRERLPREAVMCGCCILTSKSGTAGYYTDNPIPKSYKLDDVAEAVFMVGHVLRNFGECVHDFDHYRQALLDDRKDYPLKVKEFYDALLDHHSCA